MKYGDMTIRQYVEALKNCKLYPDCSGCVLNAIGCMETEGWNLDQEIPGTESNKTCMAAYECNHYREFEGNPCAIFDDVNSCKRGRGQ